MAKPEVIGVGELRTHMSAYLRAVARGETVTIGDRRRRPDGAAGARERARPTSTSSGWRVRDGSV